MVDEMTYETLYHEFKNEFQEDSPVFEHYAKKSNVDETDGMHVIFSFVVVPFVVNLFKNNDVEKLKKSFDFFENMAASNDAKITEVLEFTVLENLMSIEKSFFEGIKKFMGPETLKSCQNVGAYLKT